MPLPRVATYLGIPDFDVDGDGELPPLDIHQLVNQINELSSGGLRGEGNSSTVSGTSTESLEEVTHAIWLWLSAFNQPEETELHLRRRSPITPLRRARP